MDATLLTTVVTSAAVGAVVTATVTALNHWRDRVSQRKRVIFERSMDMARLRAEVSLRVFEVRGTAMLVVDPLIDAERYHRLLGQLYDQGKVSDPIPELPIWEGQQDLPQHIADAYDPEKRPK